MATIKEKLRSQSQTIGSWITLANPGIAEVMAQSGFDWLVVDLEHSTISISEAGDLIRTIDAMGVPCFIRTTSNDKNQIKRVLDAGAKGIIVPSVNTAQEARNAVNATQYPPIGNRGVGLGRAQGYGASFEKYFQYQSKEIADALPNLKEILSTPGVDAYLIGPYDLSCSLGIPGEFNNPIFTQTLYDIKQIGEMVNCPSGIHIVEPDLQILKEKFEEGYKFIAYGVDIRILEVNCQNATKLLKLKECK
jgi:2-dehydro-3-deoxyglucarate aldolase